MKSSARESPVLEQNPGSLIPSMSYGLCVMWRSNPTGTSLFIVFYSQIILFLCLVLSVSLLYLWFVLIVRRVTVYHAVHC